MKDIFILAITGPAGLGKSTVASKIARHITDFTIIDSTEHDVDATLEVITRKLE